MPRLTISPVLMWATASSTFCGVIKFPFPRWSLRPQRELNQSGARAGLGLALSSVSSAMRCSLQTLLDHWGGRRGCSRLVGLRSAVLAPPRRLHREPDRQDQHRAIEEWLDEEGRAKLIEARDRDGEHGDREHGPPDIHPARP